MFMRPIFPLRDVLYHLRGSVVRIGMGRKAPIARLRQEKQHSGPPETDVPIADRRVIHHPRRPLGWAPRPPVCPG